MAMKEISNMTDEELDAYVAYLQKRKWEIMEELCKNKVIEDIVLNINKNARESDDNIKDLVQDIYVDLLEKSNDLIVSLYNKKQLKYFITRIALNNIYSKTSPYYTKYKDFNNRSTNITEKNIGKADEY